MAFCVPRNCRCKYFSRLFKPWGLQCCEISWGNLTGNRSKIAKKKRVPGVVSFIQFLLEYSSCPIIQGRARLFKPQTRRLKSLFMGSPFSELKATLTSWCFAVVLHSPPVEGKSHGDPLVGLEEILPTASNGSGQGSWRFSENLSYFPKPRQWKKTPKKRERDAYFKWLLGGFSSFSDTLW